MAEPKNIDAWIQTIETAQTLGVVKVTPEFINDIWSYEVWEQKFLNAITWERWIYSKKLEN